MRVLAVVLLVLLMIGLGAWWAYQTYAPSAPPPPGRPVEEERRQVKVTAMDDGAQVQSDCMDLAHSLRAAISRGGAIPEGTRLVSLELTKRGVCLVELSKEFLQVNESGTTGESEAQNALRRALGPFDKVKSLTVLVAGNVFEGSHSGEWSEIPVRGGDAGSGSEQ